MRIEQIRKNYEIEVRWIAFPLHPETPEGGLTLEELFAGRSIDVEKVVSRLKQVAEELGLPLGKRKRLITAAWLRNWLNGQNRREGVIPLTKPSFGLILLMGKISARWMNW